jgi:formate dehydrogenase major subunit
METEAAAADGPDAQERGRAALRMVDKLLAERPDKVGHDFSETTRCLTTLRDCLIAQWRKTGSEQDRARLAKANAVLAVIVGGHFPLGAIPWRHIEKAREMLADLIER